MTLTPPPRRSAAPPSRRAVKRPGSAARAVLIGLAVGLAVLVAGGLVFTLVDGDEPAETETAAAETADPVESSSPDTWRLGYEGFGPIKLGMTLDEAAQAAGRGVTEYPDCGGGAGLEGFDELGLTHNEGRIVNIFTWGPSIRTISGAYVGTTRPELLSIYPGARAVTGQHSAPVLRITNPSGAQVDFYMQGENDSVSAIQVAGNADDARTTSACD